MGDWVKSTSITFIFAGWKPVEFYHRKEPLDCQHSFRVCRLGEWIHSRNPFYVGSLLSRRKNTTLDIIPITESQSVSVLEYTDVPLWYKSFFPALLRVSEVCRRMYSHKLYILFLCIRSIIRKAYCKATSKVKSNPNREARGENPPNLSFPTSE